MNETITYIIRHRDIPIYITNKPYGDNPEVSYSSNRSRAREFNGLEEANINMDYHIAIKKVLTETIKYEEVDHEF